MFTESFVPGPSRCAIDRIGHVVPPWSCGSLFWCAANSVISQRSVDAPVLGCRHAVANAQLREHIARMDTVRFDLAPNPLNVGPHVIGFLTVLSAPDGLEHLPMQQDLACIAREIRQHFELAPRQRHIYAVRSCAA